MMKDIKKSTSSDLRSNRIPIIRGEPTATRRLRDRDRQISNRVEEFERDGNIYPPRRRAINKEKKTWRLEIYTTIFLMIVIGGIYLLTYVFNFAVINITPRSVEISQNSLITLNNNKSTVFETYELSEKSSTDIKKTNSIDIKSKAKGEITIYNNYDSRSQKLVKNTRLQTSDGKVFRIDNAVTIPGKSGDTPGSVKVMAYADTYGKEYNLVSTQMSIPGFKGTAKYAGFYAKNESPMTGGDMGKRFVISNQDLKDVETKLIPGLESKLREKMLAYHSDDYIAVADSLKFVYESNKDQLTQQDMLKTYEQTVKARITIIKKDEFAKVLATLHLSDYNGVDNVMIANIKDLKVNISEPSYKISSSTAVTIATEYKGNIKWSIDTENIKKDLLGKGIIDFSAIMGKYSGIDTAKPELSPMWLHTFPNSINKIKVKLD